jgi:hypothetical protein
MYVRKVDHGWRAKLTNSQKKAFELVEHVVFGIEMDQPIRMLVRNRKDVGSFVNTAPISDMVQELEDEVEKEVAATKAKESPPDSSVDAEEKPAAAMDVDYGGEVVVAVIQASLAQVAGNPESEQRIHLFQDKCTRTVDTYVNLEVELTDQDSNMDRLKNSAVHKVHHMHIHAHTDT